MNHSLVGMASGNLSWNWIAELSMKFDDLTSVRRASAKRRKRRGGSAVGQVLEVRVVLAAYEFRDMGFDPVTQ